MGLTYRILLVFIFLSSTLFCSSVFATHVAGADIDYVNVGQDSFLITLNVYRECGNNNSNAQLNTGNIDLDFVSDCGQSFTLNNMTLTNGPTGTEVSQLCPSSLANSGCNGGTLPGIQHYIFQDIVVLPNTCDSWHMSWTFAARNTSTNLVGQDDMHVSSSLNSVTDQTNSSPSFNASPIPFVCNGNQVNYNFGVQDPDGDSLVYSLIAPMISATSAVTWQPGYSATAPINGIAINSATGQITFTPTTLGNFVVAVQVCEYDPSTGSLLGCVIRDIQLIVENCLNLPPTNNGGGISNTSANVANIGTDSIAVCEGELINFDIKYFDNVNVVAIDLVSDVQAVLPGATTTFTSAADSGVLNVNWQVPTNGAGNYTFAVEAYDGVCPVQGVTSNSYTIVVEPTTFASNDTSICIGDTASLSVLGGNSFTWVVLSGDPIDTVSSSPTYNASCMDCAEPNFSPNITTTYEVTSDLNGVCSNKDTVVVTVVDLGLNMLDSANYCAGDSVTVTANATVGSFLWSNGETIGDPTFSSPGTYSVTVSNGLGCVQEDSVVVNENSLPVVTIGPDIPYCDGTPFSVIKDVGPIYQSYLWHTGSTLQSHTVTELDSLVWIQVQDTNGCFGSDTLLVYTVQPPVFTLGNDTSFCDGESHVLRAPLGMTNYSWNTTTANVDSLIVGIANVYSVSVQDTNGCTGNDSIIIGIDTIPIPILPNSLAKCVEDTATLDAGVGYLTYVWNTGATTQFISADTSGNYVVTVTDSNSCVGTNGSSVVDNPVPSVNIGPDDTICIGNSVLLDAGFGFNSYLWSNGTSSQLANYDSTGNHWVEVEDSLGCLGSDTMFLLVNNLPTVNLGPNLDLCIGDTGVLDAGVGMQNYFWSNGAGSQSINVLSAGVYSVTVEDTNGCLNTDTNVVSLLSLPTPPLPADIQNCAGSTFNQLVDAGSGFILYNWMDGTFTRIRNATELDTVIWVEVTDSNGCVGSDTMYVNHTPLPAVDIGLDDTICASQVYALSAGNGGGTITSYIWSTSATTQSISIPANTGLVADQTVNYSVTVTDVLGCENADSMNLTSYALPRPVLPNDTSYCFGDPFAMTLDPGIFASYLWSNGANSPTINIGAVPSTYGVTVTFANGCENNAQMTVVENQLPQPNLGPDESFCQGEGYTKILNPGSFDQYAWSDGSFGPVLGVSTPGPYGVTVTDIRGCVNNDDIQIVENPLPPVDLGDDQYFCEDETVSTILDASSLLPSNGYNFIWNTGATTPTILISQFGQYSVTVSDRTTSCASERSIEVIPFPKANPNLGDNSVICEGQLISLDPMVDIPGYNYIWSTGATSNTINIFESGVYWVQLDAENGSCIGLTDTIEFTPGVMPVVELGDDQYVCDGQVVTLLNNLTPFPGAVYSWQDSTESTTRKVITTGTYEIAVTNECGTVYDQVYIEFQDCFGLYVPNSFTPNTDGVNETFYPKSDQEFQEYGFWVYDRWGQIVFKTNQPNYGWDGKINGELAPVGMYAWRISYVSANQVFGTRVEKVGEVYLLK